ncbi:hypothetical protein QBC35DRAFT_446356 [Podospora australis]|uniref:Uncharacterized protein n=1 Tax=Podospora australis TaxID=1536484 RepID=A0AAN6X4H6_9PEZI|nr:hypothetical protein QBC35DRAFT_446356 [Podospora australis]
MKIKQTMAILALVTPSVRTRGVGDLLSSTSSASGSAFEPPTDYDMCQSDCSLHGVPFPDDNTIQLPLEDFFSERCPEIIIGKHDDPTEASRVCLGFTGPYLTFTFEAFRGYVTESARVGWKVKGNRLNPESHAPPPLAFNHLTCHPQQNGTFVCKLPFSKITGLASTADIKHLLSGMCPNGDHEGLTLYFAFSGNVVVPGSHWHIPFQQQFPCKPGARDHIGKCTAYNCEHQYLEVSYRCSKCQVAPCEPTCDIGTAFGYQGPRDSYKLETQGGQHCSQSWGWHETPSQKELKYGIRGVLYIRDKSSHFEKIGTWAAYADHADYRKIKVKYRIVPGLPYGIDEVNIEFSCPPIDNCDPQAYSYNKKGLKGVKTFEVHDLEWPFCRHGRSYLIVSAEIGSVKPVEGEHEHNKGSY